MEDRIKNMLKKYGLSGVNKPKKTPSHPTKKGIVLAKEGDKVRIIRFGDQKMGHNYSPEARSAFKARHAKNISKGKMSAAYWADKFFWAGSGGSKKNPPKSQEKKYEEGGMIMEAGGDPKKKPISYREFAAHVATKKGGDIKQLNDLMMRISFHETGPNHRYDPMTIQGDDPKLRGRGLFQFETGVGGGGITAVNRTYQYLKNNGMEIPGWLSEAYKLKDIDVTTLTPDQQKFIWLGDQMQRPGADLGLYFTGKIDAVDYWLKYHWAGSDQSVVPKRRTSFLESMSVFEPAPSF